MEEIKNAVIESITITKADKNLLDSWIYLDYGGSGQGFGGYALYLPKSFKYHNVNSVAGHFFFRCMEIAGVDKWEDLKGKTIRVKIEKGLIVAIGHIVKDDWFNPSIDFKND